MGWWKTAKPGDKVVCIAPQNKIDAVAKATGGNVPRNGSVYTVREIRDDSPYRRSSTPRFVVLLSEIDNSWMVGREGPGWKCYVEPGMSVTGFRPVQTKSTDTGMAILKRILERPEQRIEEDA